MFTERREEVLSWALDFLALKEFPECPQYLVILMSDTLIMNLMCPDIRHYGEKVNSSDASPSLVSWVFFYIVRIDINYFVVQSAPLCR